MLLAWGCSACSDDKLNPLLQAVLPDRAVPGAAVDIVGERLEGDPLLTHIGGTSAELLFRQSNRLRVRVPQAGAGQQLLVVTVDGRPSNVLPFTVLGQSDAGL